MHVVHIISGDLWGGAETQVHALAKELRASAGVTVEALLFNDVLTAHRLRDCGMAVTVFDESRYGPVSLVIQLVRWLRYARPSIIHTHGYKECVIGTLAAKLAGGIPLVRTVHGWAETRARWWQVKKVLARAAERVLLRWQRAVVAVSDELAHRLSAYVKHANIVVIENGIDVTALQMSSGPLRLSPDRERRIGIVGRLVPVKRVDLFLQTCRLLRDEYGPRFKAVVIGDGPCAGDLWQQARQLKIDDQVEMPGFVAEVPRVMRDLDALVITSDHEGLPMTLLEAMALKVPVVAHAVGGIPVALDNGSCGWLVYEHHPQAYYRALRAALTDSTESARRAILAYDRVAALYSGSRVAQRYRTLYREIACGSQRS